ncbi:c-type cytochrome domain-containing protein [Verrucomicrobiales bacterium BCK34]|nr:c-type cytochrome domain-containing protein [Verrucomicrobiales bacterium BCK34]
MKQEALLKSSLIAAAINFLLHPESALAVDFKEDIRPILSDKCFKCHSGPRAKGKLRMDSDENFAKRIGGDDPVIVPGDAVSSLLAVKAGLPRSNGDAMPPPPARERGAEAMTTAELNLVKQWIADGAKFDASEEGEPDTAAEGAMDATVYTWVNTENKKLEAQFVASDGTNVTLKMEGGKDINYPLAKLNAESQALAKKLAAE